MNCPAHRDAHARAMTLAALIREQIGSPAEASIFVALPIVPPPDPHRIDPVALRQLAGAYDAMAEALRVSAWGLRILVKE